MTVNSSKNLFSAMTTILTHYALSYLKRNQDPDHKSLLLVLDDLTSAFIYPTTSHTSCCFFPSRVPSTGISLSPWVSAAQQPEKVFCLFVFGKKKKNLFNFLFEHIP